MPSGVVTLLFTDIEGSTRLWEEQPELMAVALGRHNDILRAAVETNRGVVFKTVGDAFCAAFCVAADAVTAAMQAQWKLVSEPWPESLTIRVRMGVHSGNCLERDADYFGPTVNRVARLEATAHGGQIVCSAATVGLLHGPERSDFALLDLGEHRLKDLGVAERVYQVHAPGLQDRFPPLRSLSNPALANNLPVQVTGLVGRDTEMGEIRYLLATSRLVTLTGAGGVGKTRLALQAAAEMVDAIGDGTWLVELANFSDPELVPAAVAEAVGLAEELGRSRFDSVVEGLRERSLLLVLDNCEHVVDSCAKLANALLRACPRVAILATSREPLAIAGECIYRVPSLSFPDTPTRLDTHELLEFDAVRLFVERAAEQQPGRSFDDSEMSALASLCRRLDGIPLAIELAAARLRSLSIREIEAKLDDRFRILSGGNRTALPRQRTLRAMIDWSYDLLNEPERQTFERLSVFAGGWDLEAAENVCITMSADPWDVIDILASLVDKSLVQAQREGAVTRYRLLESVRQYAADCLGNRGAEARAALKDAHSRYYLDWAEVRTRSLIGSEQQVGLARYEVEHPNLTAALEHLLDDTAEPEAALRLGAALRLFWMIRGHLAEGVEAMTLALERSSGLGASPARGAAFNCLAPMQLRRGQPMAARQAWREGLVIARAVGDSRGEVEALIGLSQVAMAVGNHDTAVSGAGEAVDAARRLGDDDETARALGNLGLILDRPDEAERARAAYTESLEIRASLGDQRRLGVVFANLGSFELAQGDLGLARAHSERALAIAETLDDPYQQGLILFNLALAHLLDGDVTAASVRCEEAVRLAERSHNQPGMGYALLGMALCRSAGQPVVAARLHGCSDRILSDLWLEAQPFDLRQRDDDQAALRRLLGDQRFEEAHREGRALSDAEGVALATAPPAPAAERVGGEQLPSSRVSPDS